MKQVFGASLLVAGTSIGAGMLALPVVTAAGGFFPSLFIYFLCWIFMTSTGLLFLELCLKLPPDANLITMAATYLGRSGKIFAWILYLFLFYCLLIAYISGGGSLLQSWFSIDVSFLQILFTSLLGVCVYFGAKVVDRLNWILMGGLILTYGAFVLLGLPKVHFERLQPANWGVSLYALPVIFTAFSFQGIIPSLTTYLRRDARQIRFAIIAGTSIAFFIYLLWELLILGIIPLEGLEQAKNLGQTAVAPLNLHVGVSIFWIGQAFAFFAISTSFLGVGLGLIDFLADGLTLPKIGVRKLFLAALTFLPPLIVSLTNPTLFIVALVAAGGIGCALLLGFLPTLMVWVSRYRHEGHGGPIQLRGGRPLLLLFFLFVLFELFLEKGG
jgi:tyrosine-specific transport protein